MREHCYFEKYTTWFQNFEILHSEKVIKRAKSKYKVVKYITHT